MKAQASMATALAVATACVAAGGSATAAPTAGGARKGEPLVDQLVAIPGGGLRQRKVRAKRAAVKIDGRTCAVAAATPLAALLQVPLRRDLRFRDYGACSRRPADGSGLFVKAIGKDVNRGLNGWVYKVGRKLGTAGAADPAGPFGNGRLRNGAKVAWFYCVFVDGSCQRSLEARAATDGVVTVTAYDDAGKGVPAARARVSARPRSGATLVRTTDASGQATLPPGTYTLRARKPGLIPAFPVKVTIDG